MPFYLNQNPYFLVTNVQMIKIDRTTRNLFDVGSAAFLCLARYAGLDPFDELVLGDGHTLADLQSREAFAVDQFIGIGAGDTGAFGRFIAGHFSIGAKCQIDKSFLTCKTKVQQLINQFHVKTLPQDKNRIPV